MESRLKSPLSKSLHKRFEDEGVPKTTLRLLNKIGVDSIKYCEDYIEGKNMNDPKNILDMVENIIEKYVSPYITGYSENIDHVNKEKKEIEINMDKYSTASRESVGDYIKRTGYSFTPALERIKKRYPEHFGS